MLDEGVRLRCAGEKLAPVDPGAKVGGAGHIGRGGDDARGKRRVALRQIVQNLAESGLCGNLAFGLKSDQRDRQSVIPITAAAFGEELAVWKQLGRDYVLKSRAVRKPA